MKKLIGVLISLGASCLGNSSFNSCDKVTIESYSMGIIYGF